MGKRPAKSNSKVFPVESNIYAEWRVRRGAAVALREDGSPPPERLLQAVWFHQRLCRDKFATLDGRRVQVLHPGFWNREAGPDFRDAVLQFEGEPARTGDVEVDLDSSAWHGHGHDRNPAFRDVALHVVWEGDAQSGLPTLTIRSLLDAPLSELAVWLGSESAKAFPDALSGQCCAPLRDLPAGKLAELLRQAALVRFQGRAARMQARAREAGWEQALWEGLFRALGYKHNAWPMLRLAELRSRWSPGKARITPVVLQARLLGIAGLLPLELPRVQAPAGDYVRRLWDSWWRDRETFSDCTMPRELWRLNGVRPANHPQRRLALASRWLCAGGLPARLQRWCTAGVAVSRLVSSLNEVLQVLPDDFWSWHWTIRSKRFARPQPLVGATRVTDLAVNAILPWLWVRAAEGGNRELQSEMARRYLAWPAAQDNAVLRLARQRLLGATGAETLSRASSQQGLLQIGRDFCEHSNALCAQCQFPELVRQWMA